MKISLLACLILFAIPASAGYQELVKKYLRIEEPIILDCGANDGRTAGYWKKAFPNSTILAVEADPKMANILIEKTKNMRDVLSFNLVLSNVDGMAEFYPNVPGQGTEQGSTYKQSKDKWYWGSRVSEKPVMVQSKTLDTFCKDINIRKIDFLFLDMQGGELQMLKASKTILPTVSVICTEVFFTQCYEGIPLYPEIDKFLKSQGFVQIGMHKKGHFADAYYTKKELYQRYSKASFP